MAQNGMIVASNASLEPANMSELKALAKDAAASRFYGASTPEQALLLMMTGRDLGLSYTQALRAFHVIEGKPTLTADGAVAVCVSSGECEYFRQVESTPTSATWETKRKGAPAPQRYTFTVEDAQRANLIKPSSGWAKYPARMCSARAKMFLARDVYPELLLGLMDPDEAREVAADRGPRRVEPAPVEYVVTGEPVVEHVAGAFAEAIADAATLDDLTSVAKRIKAASLNAEDRDALAAAYKARASELRGAA